MGHADIHGHDGHGHDGHGHGSNNNRTASLHYIHTTSMSSDSDTCAWDIFYPLTPNALMARPPQITMDLDHSLVYFFVSIIIIIIIIDRKSVV